MQPSCQIKWREGMYFTLYRYSNEIFKVAKKNAIPFKNPTFTCVSTLNGNEFTLSLKSMNAYKYNLVAETEAMQKILEM